MKGLLLSLSLVFLLAAGTEAHDGMIALFVDEALSDCDAIVGMGETVDVQLFYVRGDGPEIGHAFEFRLLKSSGAITFGEPAWHPSVIMPHIGELELGISVAAYECIGVGLDIVYLGTISINNSCDLDTFTVSVVDHPRGFLDPAIMITLCEPDHPMHSVIGNTFVFNGTCTPPGVSNPEEKVAVEESTWGAIKSLYSD